MNAMFAPPGGWEIVLVFLVILLLFGAKKLPELARGSGRALRIFKAETKGLVDDEDESKTSQQREIEARNADDEQTNDPAATDPIVREQRDGTTS